MNHKPLKICLHTLCIAMFLLSLSIAIVILSTPVYGMAISLFNIEQATGLTKEVLINNYHVLIGYLVNPFQANLQMPNFVSSVNGLAHFKDVKRLFLIDLGLVPLLGLQTFRVLKQIKQQHQAWLYVKPLQRMMIAPAIITCLVSIAFQKVFLLFHQLLFTDTNWIFDPRQDPIIMALPEEYFMMCFIMVLGLFISMSYGVYWLIKNNFNKDSRA